MHQTKKGNQWYFGMKAHFGVDSRTKLIHVAVATPANVADSTVLPDLLHGKETRVWGDQAYRGQRAVIRQHAPKAQDFVSRRYRHRGVVDEVERAKNLTKSKVRARVEHSIGIIKRVFAVQRKKITAAFDGGRITSDGGVMLLAQAERRLGIAEAARR